MEKEIDLKMLWRIMIKHYKLIAGITVGCTLVTVLATVLFMTPKYKSDVLLYVENKQSDSESLNINDITAAQKLVNTSVIIFQNDVVLQKVMDSLELYYEMDDFKEMISLSSVNSTEVLKIEVTSTDPQEAADIANLLSDVGSSEFLRIVKSGSIELVSPATAADKPSSPNLKLNLAIGLIAGLILSFLFVLVMEMLDTTVKPEDDLYKIYNIPVFAEVMDFDSKGKGEHS